MLLYLYILYSMIRMYTRTFVFFLFGLGLSLSAAAQKREATDRKSSKTIQVQVPDTVVEQQGSVVTEEPVGKPTKKVKVMRPKDMKYRITLLEVEFETEQYRSRLVAAQGDERRALLQELINKVAHIKQIKSAEYDQDYTQVIVILPDDSEYRVKL